MVHDTSDPRAHDGSSPEHPRADGSDGSPTGDPVHRTVMPPPQPETPATHDPRLRPGYQPYPKHVAMKDGSSALAHSAAHEAELTGATAEPVVEPVSPAAWRALEAKAHAEAHGEIVADGYPKDITITVYSKAEEDALVK